MKTQAQSKKESLIEKIIEVIKDFSIKEGGITYAELESVFGKDSLFIATLSNTLKVSF